MIQRRCETCSGSGLVERGGKLRKCLQCGGFFPWQVCCRAVQSQQACRALRSSPWQSWGQFFSATADPGNGGPLQQPRGQTSVLYKCASAWLLSCLANGV